MPGSTALVRNINTSEAIRKIVLSIIKNIPNPVYSSSK